MPRTILYARPAQPGDHAAPSGAYYAQRAGAPAQDDLGDVPGDDFATRLAKYIPAEALALVALITSIEGITDEQMIAIVVVAAIGQLLNQLGERLSAADRPAVRQYVFALIAYAAWVLGTTPPVSDMLGVDRTTATIVMASTAYLLPLLDPPTHKWLDPQPSAPRLRR